MTTHRPRARPPRRPASRASASDSSAPVGLPGELITMPRVRGVTAARSASAVSAKPSSSCVRDDDRRRAREFDLLDERRPARARA